MKHWLLTLCLVLLSGCATLMGHDPQSLFVRSVSWSVSDIRVIATTILPVGVGSVSSNGRTLRSRFFYPGRKEYKDGENAIDRYIAQFVILGDGRPYDVEVTVYHERRTLTGNKLAYVKVGVDQALTQEMFTKLEAELTKRREDRNVIDDFRVF